MSAPFQTGEVVDITIRGARVMTCTERGLFVAIPGGPDYGVSLPTGADGTPVDAVAVKLVQPVAGPARPGDIWRDHLGCRWLAFEVMSRYDGPEVRLTNGFNERYLTDICDGATAPVLEYRVPEPPAAEPDPVPGADCLPDVGQHRVTVEILEYTCPPAYGPTLRIGVPVWSPDALTVHDFPAWLGRMPAGTQVTATLVNEGGDPVFSDWAWSADSEHAGQVTR